MEVRKESQISLQKPHSSNSSCNPLIDHCKCPTFHFRWLGVHCTQPSSNDAYAIMHIPKGEYNMWLSILCPTVGVVSHRRMMAKYLANTYK